jgi:hypothetical protein
MRGFAGAAKKENENLRRESQERFIRGGYKSLDKKQARRMSSHISKVKMRAY